MSLKSEVFEQLGYFYLGRTVEPTPEPLLYDSRGLLTHGVCLGMTGSGKTGLCIGLLEEAAMDGVPAIIIDPKGDLGNLMLTFPDLQPADFEPWVDDAEAQRAGMSVSEFARQKAERWKSGLADWGQGPDRIRRLKETCDFALYTPGSNAGRQVSMLSSLEAPTSDVLGRSDLLADRIENTVSGLLGLLNMDADPIQSSEHVFLSQVFQQAWSKGQSMDLVAIIRALQNPPFEQVGVLHVDDVLPQRSRMALAMRLNNLVASPSFASWLEGDSMDISKILYAPDGKPRIAIFSINHLGDAERMFFVTLLLDRILGWMRAQAGTSSLRALVYMDEVFGYLPPVANPPSKKPLLTMLKQARAHGLGLVLATQNPADLDYKALSNAGTWMLGRLQTDRDIARVIEGLQASGDFPKAEIEAQIRALKSRQFVLHSVHRDAPEVFETRWVMSYLKGPMTREDIERLNQTPGAPPISAAEPSIPAQTQPAGEAYYLPVRVPPRPDTKLVYRPMLFGSANWHGSQQTSSINRIVGFGTGPVPVDWTRSNTVDFGVETLVSTPEDGTFLDAPREARDPKTLNSWKTGFAELLARSVQNNSFACPSLRLKSTPGESAESFYQRVNDELRIKRDAEIDKLHAAYDKKLRQEQDQVNRAHQKLEREQSLHRELKMKGAVSVGSSLLNAFSGRRGAVTRAAKQTTADAMKAQRKAQDVEQASTNLQKEIDDVHRVQAELEAELHRVAARWDSSQHPVQTSEVPVKKQEIEVMFVGLVYVPYWVSPSNERIRAF